MSSVDVKSVRHWESFRMSVQSVGSWAVSKSVFWAK